MSSLLDTSTLCVEEFHFVKRKGLIGRLLNIKWFGGFMGKYCYSIYVMQWIVQVLIGNGNKLIGLKFYSDFRKFHARSELFLDNM